MLHNFEKSLIRPSKGTAHELIQEYKNKSFNYDIEFEEIRPKVFVYKNIFSNPREIIDLLELSVKDPQKSIMFRDWIKWGGQRKGDTVYGQYVAELGKGLEKEELTFDEFKRTQAELSVVVEVIKNFFIATDHYINYWNLEGRENWIQYPPSFCRYIAPSEVPKSNLFMNYHTDYEIQKASEPGDKHVITTTMYLNDNYEGGELLFKEGNEKFSYKPKEGDLIVFPSGHPSVLMEGEEPIMHGVSPVPPGDKDRYIVRMFHQIYSDGDDVKNIIKKKILDGR